MMMTIISIMVDDSYDDDNDHVMIAMMMRS